MENFVPSPSLRTGLSSVFGTAFAGLSGQQSHQKWALSGRRDKGQMCFTLLCIYIFPQKQSCALSQKAFEVFKSTEIVWENKLYI